MGGDFFCFAPLCTLQTPQPIFKKEPIILKNNPAYNLKNKADTKPCLLCK